MDQDMSNENDEYVFEDLAKNPRKKANLISRLFFWYSCSCIYTCDVHCYNSL